jgi:SAM-dependent methyltransferase
MSFDVPTLAEIRKLSGRYFCPICCNEKDAFNPGGVGRRRPNAKCPDCGSLERHRLLMVYLEHRVWPSLGTRKKDLLHIAPEKFLVERLKNRHDTNYISGDLLSSDCMTKLDLTDMPFWDSQFDLVICSHVLEHIPDDAKAMKELFRIIRTGGYLLVLVPISGDTTYEDFSITDPAARKKHFGQADHVRVYGWDIMDRLATAGFRTGRWPATSEMGDVAFQVLACRKRIIIECRK